MTETATYTPLNSIQLHLLKMFSYAKRDESLQELKSVLFNYYQNKLKLQTNDFWNKNQLDSAKMEKIMYGHNRVSSK